MSTGIIPCTSTEHSILSQSKLPSVEHWKFSSAGLATRSLSVAHVGVTVAGGGVGEGEGGREGVGEEGAAAAVVVTGEGVASGWGHGR